MKEDNNADNADNASLGKSNDKFNNAIYNDLPEVLKKITSGFENREKDILLLSALGVLSSCLPNIIGTYDGNEYCPNLYIFIIAPPASGKGVMKWARKLIVPIHKAILNHSLDDLYKFKIEKSNKRQNPPPIRVKILPGNVSSAKFYDHLKNAIDSLLIFETEADSLSNMLQQDWGNFSDIMRKAFHHETTSISRKGDNLFIEIEEPKLSIVLSGTPNQIRSLIPSKVDGLFSRFIFYYFDDLSRWKDVSFKIKNNKYKSVFDSVTDDIQKLYIVLNERESKIRFGLTKNQWDTMQNTMKYLVDTIIDTKKGEFRSVVIRSGLILFRVAMILTVLRKKDEI